jgi:hypothetical protein
VRFPEYSKTLVTNAQKDIFPHTTVGASCRSIFLLYSEHGDSFFGAFFFLSLALSTSDPTRLTVTLVRLKNSKRVISRDTRFILARSF